MESPYYEMTHDFEEENRLFQSGYVKGYHDAVMKWPDIVRCRDCKWAEVSDNEHTWCDHVDHEFCHNNDWFCADGERRTDDA